MLLRRLLGYVDGRFRSQESAVHREFVDLAFRRLRLGYVPTANEIENAMIVIDSGQLDEMLQQQAPQLQPADPELYADVKPFDHNAWKDRHDRT